MEINKKYSYRDLGERSLKHLKAEEFNNTRIIGSNFFVRQKEGEVDVVKDIFPDGMTGVLFDRCNLDNVYVSPLNTVGDNCCHRILQEQNDQMDWVLDPVTMKPVEPTAKKKFIELGIPLDPKYIPKDKLLEPITSIVEYNLLELGEVL